MQPANTAKGANGNAELYTAAISRTLNYYERSECTPEELGTRSSYKVQGCVSILYGNVFTVEQLLDMFAIVNFFMFFAMLD